MPHPLDEYPVHQTPLSMSYAGTSDRSFYDRSYFNAHDRTGDTFLITGLGIYPNLGVIDAYALLKRGSKHHCVRMSDAFDDSTDRINQSVGPYRIEVIEPLQKVRLICDADQHGLGFDVIWEGSFPALDETRHVMRTGPRITLDAQRFAQVGTWSGEIRLGGERIAVTPETWLGTRDRSWGIRPVGEAEPPGRAAAEPTDGFWWLYVPIRFEDHALVIICQEKPDGFRTLNDAVRIHKDGRHEQMGWPRIDFRYRSGTRHPEGARIHLTDPAGRPVVVDVETLGGVPLHVGAGYGGDPDWGHGQWRGRDWVEGVTYDVTDPAIAPRIPFGVIDHVARATCDGQEGWGLFEHASVGRHDPTGFTDFMSVAP